MNEQRAREILGDAVRTDGTLDRLGPEYLGWTPLFQPHKATLDGEFTADELEAIAWWIRHQFAARVAQYRFDPEVTVTSEEELQYDTTEGWYRVLNREGDELRSGKVIPA